VIFLAEAILRDFLEREALLSFFLVEPSGLPLFLSMKIRDS
jgi:hypothetical protein